MKLQLLPVLVCLLAAPLAAQERPVSARDAVYLEVGGYGGYYSLNYDRRISDRLAVRVGGSETAFTNLDGERFHITALPVGVGFLIDPEMLRPGASRWFGGAHRWIEIGPGLVLGSEGSDRESAPEERTGLVVLTGTLGFRLQRPTQGWLLRIGLTPFLPLKSPPGTFFTGVSGGISVGYSF